MADREAQYYIERMERAIPYAEKGKIEVSVEAAKEIIDLLKEQPEIVRCKGCKHWVPGYITDEDDFIPPRCLDNHGVGWSANDFCSYGKRREEEEV